MITVRVITYDGGAILQEVFNAIAMVADGPTYLSLLKITMVFSLSWFLLQGIFKRQQVKASLSWLIAYYVVFNILLLPKVSVQIIDRVNPNQQYAVANVPWGVAVPASFGSQIGDALTQKFEEVFSLPNDLNYSQTGMMMASRLVSSANQFRVTNPTLQKNLNSFVNQCVFYDILLHKYSFQDLLSTGNIWQLISTNASPARSFLYNGNIVTCRKGAALINKAWLQAINDATANYGLRIFPGQSEAEAKATLLAKLPIAYQYLTGISQSASELIQQNILANSISTGIKSFATQVNAPAALENFAFTKAQIEKRNVYKTIGEQAAYWLPIMQNVFAAMIYGSFLLILPMILLPIGWNVFRGYLLSLIWIELWSPLYAILNLVMTFYAARNSHAAVMLANGQATLSLLHQSNLSQANQDMSLVAGYLTMAIPFLSYGLVSRGLAGTFSQLAQYIGGVAQHTAQSAGIEESTGNISIGNTQFDNNSQLNTSAFHWDTQGSALSGSMATGMGDGAIVTRTASDFKIVNSAGAISTSAANLHLSNSIREAASKQADIAWNNALSETEAASTAATAGLREIYDFNASSGDMQNDTSSDVLSKSIGINNSLNQVKHLIDRFAKENHISAEQGAQVLGSYYALHDEQISVNSNKEILGKVFNAATGVSGGARIDIGERNEGNHFTRFDTRQLLQSAESFDQQTGFNHQVDDAIRAIHEESFRSGSEENNRLSHGIGSHFETVNSLRSEAQNNFAKAESFREMASFAKEQSATVDYNASGEFMDWLSHQPVHGGQGAMGINQAESIVNHNQTLAQEYAQQFVNQQTQKWQQEWHDKSFSANTIYQDFENNQKEGESAATLNAVNALNSTQVIDEAAGINSVTNSVVSPAETLKKEVTNSLNQQQEIIKQGKTQLKQNYTNNSKEVKQALDKVPN